MPLLPRSSILLWILSAEPQAALGRWCRAVHQSASHLIRCRWRWRQRRSQQTYNRQGRPWWDANGNRGQLAVHSCALQSSPPHSWLGLTWFPLLWFLRTPQVFPWLRKGCDAPAGSPSRRVRTALSGKWGKQAVAVKYNPFIWHTYRVCEDAPSVLLRSSHCSTCPQPIADSSPCQSCWPNSRTLSGGARQVLLGLNVS